MDLRQLSTFRAAARTGSFAQTALDLHYAPSTVTEQVRALEASMDASLFERHGRGVRLTQAGRRLLPYAERLVDMAEDARRAVAGEVSIAGSVTIGGLETLCAFRLPRALASMRRSHPELRVKFDRQADRTWSGRSSTVKSRSRSRSASHSGGPTWSPRHCEQSRWR